MTTYNQFVNGTRFVKKYHKWKRRALAKSPHKAGSYRVSKPISPKKPCSAKRAVGLVKLRSGIRVYCYIPGIGQAISDRARVLISGGRRNDLPGIKYKIVSSKRYYPSLIKKPFAPVRIRSRSVYGLPKLDGISATSDRAIRRDHLRNNKSAQKQPKNKFFGSTVLRKLIDDNKHKKVGELKDLLTKKLLNKRMWKQAYMTYLDHPNIYLKKFLFYDYYTFILKKNRIK
jgi:small subunit ribosomal protein S12